MPITSIITFGDVPNQLVFDPVLGSYVGPSISEGGFQLVASYSDVTGATQSGLLEYSPLPGLASLPAITGVASNPLSPTLITLMDGGAPFAVGAIALDAPFAGSPLVSEDVTFVGTDVSGNEYQETFQITSPGLQTFHLDTDFLSNLKTFSWYGTETLGGVPVPAQLLVAGIEFYTPPDTLITYAPGALTGGTTAKFEFHSNDPLASYEYKLDNATTWTTVTTHTVTLTGLSNGQHTFEVAAVDANGIVDPSPAEYTWTEDQTKPVTNNSFVTVTTTPTTVRVDVSPAGAVTKIVQEHIAIDGGTPVAAKLDSTSGVWTATFTDLQISEDTPPQVTVQSTDNAGNVGPLFELDTVVLTSTISQALTNDTGISQTDLITTDGRVTVSGQTSEPVDSVEIWNAATNTLVGTATIDPADPNHESWSFSGTLGGGTYQLYAKLYLDSNIGETSPQPTIEVVAAPTVVADRTGVNVGASVTANAAHGVLANDSDPGGQPLDVAAVFGVVWNVGQTSEIIAGKFGSLTLNIDGSYTYTAFSNDVLPASGVAEDVFTYTAITSLGGTADSTLTVTVTAAGLNYIGGSPNSIITVPSGGHSPVLDGGAGNDTVIAPNGATVLIGGPGDTLTGSVGTDTYVFMGQFGANTITNYNPHKDLIQLDHNEFTDLNAVMKAALPTASGTVITDPTNSANNVTLVGVGPASLHFDASHFHLV